MNEIASERNKWIRRNRYYYENLINFLNLNINEDSSIIEIGCGTGYLLSKLKSSRAAGIDISPEMIKQAERENPQIKFYLMDAEEISIDEKFDYIIISDTVGYFDDVQKAFEQLHKLCKDNTRIIITYINFLWMPLLNLAEFLRLKMPQVRNNWLDMEDIKNLLSLSGFDVIKSGRKQLFPVYIPLLSLILNKFIANLPIVNLFCLSKFIIARSTIETQKANTVSVIVPARNEKGNIESIVRRIPQMGENTEVIFVEGNSTDDTYEEIEKICKNYSGKLRLSYFRQEGTGKADAVRKGFDKAVNDIFMILDADMTAPPEDLIKFYDIISEGRAEFINGSRLVYPLEKDAMRTLNMLGNKFFSIMFTWILNQRIKDTLCGTKVISKKNYLKLKTEKKYFGDFDPFGDFDLIFGAAKMNLKFAEVPIRYKARVYGKTNISRFKHGLLLLKMTLFAMRKIKFT
ncbi:MAG: Undecaprenyl-phosphate 4-deoxy-4-formamido-L-arabinose transferase [Ignavibacteria bacterium]|nr:Undecaprenyl-phosphate 4-deoxy-4-formamido-L-arabinose transferase [Ignavibacteria bacterium]